MYFQGNKEFQATWLPRNLQALLKGSTSCPSYSQLQGTKLIIPMHDAQVLEHAIYDCEERCRSLQKEGVSAQQSVSEARQQAAVLREQQLPTERALQQQMRRVHALEGLRLQDIQVWQ